MGEAGYFALFIAAGIIGGSLLLGPVGQALARLIGGRSRKEGLTTGEMTAERLSELEARIVELETTHDARAAELEERVEFAERLLAQASGERRPIGPDGVAGAVPDPEPRAP